PGGGDPPAARHGYVLRPVPRRAGQSGAGGRAGAQGVCDYPEAREGVMPGAETDLADQRALKILFETYWTSSGWRRFEDRITAPADFEYAKRAGLMFEPVRVSHRDTVERAITAVRAIDRVAVANSFVVSLTTRRLEIRSALGSYAVLQHFPVHEPILKEY